MNAAVLQNIFRREGRSLLQYVNEAFPWAPAAEQKTLTELHALIAEENEATEALAVYLRRHHINLPYLGAYPDFTPLNFVSLDFLLPRLVEAQRKAVAALEKDLAALTDAGAREVVEKILAMKQRHLKKLEALATPQPATAGT